MGALRGSTAVTILATMKNTRAAAVRRALEIHPGTLRALAREAGVSHTLLARIRDGDRAATEETVEALAEAMERFAAAHADAAARLRNSLKAGD
jgi:hypothetical protein